MSIKYIYRNIISVMLLVMLSFSIASGRIFELKATSIDGREVSLSNYEGKILLVVNTASRCGFTRQYKSLEKIYNKYKERDFVVLAFPSNDFRQELSTNEEITRCGFTPQYKSLEKIFKKYKERDFVVLAFPSNDFRQELSTNEEIKDFCEVYELSFPIFAKGKVKGFEKQQVFKYLTEDSNGRNLGEIRWNFEKFLVSREGKLVKRFRSSVDPNQDEITSAIESLL